VEIRVEHRDDADSVAELHREAFGGDHGAVVAALVDELRAFVNSRNGLSLVAEHDGARWPRQLDARKWCIRLAIAFASKRRNARRG
jgi:hypothetical protein